jgi:hypothetical protein
MLDLKSLIGADGDHHTVNASVIAHRRTLKICS